MMNESKNNLSKRLYVRLNEKDYKAIYQAYSNSMCRKLSEFVRQKLLGKPIVMKYRNQSLDDFMTEMIKLRNELNAIGNNYNQAVKKLHTLDQIQEFKNWVLINENHQKNLLEKVGEIKIKINQISDKWLQ
jgi:hypothetical protein